MEKKVKEIIQFDKSQNGTSMNILIVEYMQRRHIIIMV